MLRLVSYDSSSDDADLSGNEDEDEECQIILLDDESIINFLVKELVNIVSKENGDDETKWIDDRKGNVDMRWRSKKKDSKNKTDNDASKARIRRKRKRNEIGGNAEKSSTEWSDLDSWSSDSGSSTSSSSENESRNVGKPKSTAAKPVSDHEFSEDSDFVYTKIVLEYQKQRQYRKPKIVGRPPKTKGEIDVNDLPPIEKLCISVPDDANLRRVGVVASLVDTLAIIQSDYGVPPLDEESWLVNENKQTIGQIFEVFGPVPRPFYSIRFNKTDDARQLLSVGCKIFYIPDNENFTKTIFADSLRHFKGSDASWEDNNEPPADAVEFSDDEEERRWKAQRRGKAAPTSEVQGEEEGGSHEIGNRPKATPRRRFQRGRGRGGYSNSDSRPFVGNAESSHPFMQNPWHSFGPQHQQQQHYPPPPPNFFQPPQMRPPPAQHWTQQRFAPPTFRAPLPPPFFQPVMQRLAFEGAPTWRPPRFEYGNRGRGRGSRGGPAMMDRRYMQNE